MFNMNFTKDLVLCEIIERHELLLLFFLLSDYHTEWHSFTVMVCMNECEIPIIKLLILGTFFAFKF